MVNGLIEGNFPMKIMGFSGYPLANYYILLWKDPPFLMGKSTILGGMYLSKDSPEAP